jgi:ribosomal protein S27E
MEVEECSEFKGLKTHQERVAYTHGWYAALDEAERRKTVRRKPPVRHAKHKITCSSCGGSLIVIKHDSEWLRCSQCGDLYRK